MLDIIAYLDAPQRVAEHAREALPSSPIRPDNRGGTVRHRVSVALHRLAERLDPQPVRRPTTTAASSHSAT